MNAGEKLWVFQGAEAPETWMIVERRDAAGETQRGLVPETFVGIDAAAEAAAAADAAEAAAAAEAAEAAAKEAAAFRFARTAV